jgi:hypothetical protein
MKHRLCVVLLLILVVGVSFSSAATAQSAREIFYDPDGLIVHHGPNGELDGGDTAQREGWYWLGVWLRQHTAGLRPWPKPRMLNFQQVIALLEPGHDGVFYRHPKLPPWNDPHGKEFGFSRDQMVPLVAAMGVWGMKDEIRRLWDALPEDLLGKHAFNGNWRNFLGQDGPNCGDIKKRGCDATADCSLKVDTRDCSLKVDTRDCSLKVDTRDCSLQVDTRDCSLQVDTRSCGHDGPFGIHFNDPICEAAKAAQNAGYAAAKGSCEAGKAAQNAAYAATKGRCETEKATQNAAYAAEKAACEGPKAAQNAAYKAEHDTCEFGKAAQNVAYKVEHDTCELAKSTSKAACEAQKTIDSTLCMITNVHSGDLIGPMTVNLFRRAMDESPFLSVSAALPLPPVNVVGGVLGESELAVNVGLRLAAASRDRGDTGDDLNLIVMMLMAKLRYPSQLIDEAVTVYAATRPMSYGSYLKAYHAQYGDDARDMEHRITVGIASGWRPDKSAPNGAICWYHRPETGANPQLAELYETIVDRFIH